MKGKIDSKLKALIFIFSFIFIAIIIAIITFFLQEEETEQDENPSTLNTTETYQRDITGDTDDIKIITDENRLNVEANIEQDSQKISLEKSTDIDIYFMMKKCMEKYYKIETTEEALGIIDKEAIESLNKNRLNISNLYNSEISSKFCIDEIYELWINSNKNIYVVYYRIENGASYKSQAMIIKVDSENHIFSIYPNETLKEQNYIRKTEEGKLLLYVSDEIEENNYNSYDSSAIRASDSTIMKELFYRFKFDLSFDLTHLYEIIDVDYKEERFNTIEKFNKYINENKALLLNDKLKKYKINSYNDYNQYIGICESNRHYIFNTKNIMEYTLLLDNYTTEIEQYIDIYDDSTPMVQAKYCIDRVKRALNEKNYEFIYSKLDPIPKNNYYSNYSDFEDFLKRSFYDNNNFEYEDYIVISYNLFQYKVKVTDATGKAISYRRFDIAIELKENRDFTISITQ